MLYDCFKCLALTFSRYSQYKFIYRVGEYLKISYNTKPFLIKFGGPHQTLKTPNTETPNTETKPHPVKKIILCFRSYLKIAIVIPWDGWSCFHVKWWSLFHLYSPSCLGQEQSCKSGRAFRGGSGLKLTKLSGLVWAWDELFVLGAQKSNQNNLATLLNFPDLTLLSGFYGHDLAKASRPVYNSGQETAKGPFKIQV